MRLHEAMTGKFITFEGGDGAGKSTQIRLHATRLQNSGRTDVTTREPGGTPTAETIRRLLLSGLAEPLGAEGEAVLFAAARADHVDQIIRPALERGDWVLSDRFVDSTRVYQGGAGADETLLNALERVAVGSTLPDLTIILDIPAELGLERVRGRLVAVGAPPDRFEAEALAEQERRRQAFLAIAARESNRCVVVDAVQAEEQVADEIWRTVRERLLGEAAA
jgi:dTMP kinase